LKILILNYIEASEHIEEEIYRLTDKTDKDGEKVTKNNEEPEQNTDEEMHVTKIQKKKNSSSTDNCLKKRRLEELTQHEKKKIDLRIDEEKKLAKFRYEKEMEIWDLKKQHLVKLQQIEIREAEAKATLAELMLKKFR
jgi:hypothetical protein